MKALEARNPFPRDADRREIWEILVRRDIDAFLAADWKLTGPDFVDAAFSGIDAGKVGTPDAWRLRFASLADYRLEWLRQAREFQGVELADIGKREFLLRATVLRDIDVNREVAVAHKKFDGVAITTAGARIRLLWQTLYFMRRARRRWKIAGFLGYLPNPMPIPGE